MKIRQLMDILSVRDPDADVFVAFFYANGTSETFDIEEVTDNNGHGGLLTLPAHSGGSVGPFQEVIHQFA